MAELIFSMMIFWGGWFVGQSELQKDYRQKCQKLHNIYKCDKIIALPASAPTSGKLGE